MRSLTDVVRFRDAARRLRAEIHDVFAYQVPTSIQINATIRDMQPGAAELSLTPAAPSVVQGAARGLSVSGGRLSAVVTPGTGGRVISQTLEERLLVGQRLSVEQRLSERPADIREAARALSEAIADQIGYLNSIRPNEPEPLARQGNFIAFLQQIAQGLDALALSIDRAMAAGSPTTPEPILLGRAADIARKLSEAVVEGLERNRAYIVDCSIKLSVFATGYEFLHSLGVDGTIASIVSGLMNVRLPKGSKSKK